MQAVTTIGLDIAKSIFQVHGVDAEGNVVVRRKLKRRYIVAFFQKLPRCLVGIEACASSHHWARELQALGHTVRLMPPAYVKPYVKRQKNDAADAEAICEAVTRANMRFVATKTPEQQSCLMLHRTRHLFIRQQTAVINAIRLFTPVEHAVLAAWLKLPTPAEATGIDLKRALAELGVSELPGGHYTYEDAGVVRILLESIERRLPSFAVSSITADGEQTLSFARQYRDPEGKPLRKTSLLPPAAFGIDWALTAPGYSWPVVCHLIWIPGYERYAVTASADSPDMYGYCDFALGSFENGRPVIDAVGEIIKRDWAEQREDHGQDHRELFLGGGLIDRATAERWAAEVWPAGQRRAFI